MANVLKTSVKSKVLKSNFKMFLLCLITTASAFTDGKKEIFYHFNQLCLSKRCLKININGFLQLWFVKFSMINSNRISSSLRILIGHERFGTRIECRVFFVNRQFEVDGLLLQFMIRSLYSSKKEISCSNFVFKFHTKSKRFLNGFIFQAR